MINKEYNYEEINTLLNASEADFSYKEETDGNITITLKSNLKVNDGVSIIRLPFKKVHYGEFVIVNAILKNNTEDFGTAFCGVNHYKLGQKVVKTLKNGKTVTGGECQFFGRGFKDYRYHFITPQGVDSAEFYIYCNSGSIEIKNLEVYISKSLPVFPSINTTVKCVAHQGMPGYAPLNTMPSFHLAKRAGFRECVINTNFTSDGKLVVIHNDTIDESSDGSGIIHNMTFEHVRGFDFGSFYNDTYKGIEIPLLEDVIRMMAKSGMRPVLRLSNHFKGEKSNYLRQICEMIKNNGLEGQCTAKAFCKEVLNELSKIAGDMFRYGYCCFEISPEDADWIKGLGNDIYFDINYKTITDEHIKLSLENGIAVESWIINDFEAIMRLAEKGVTGFTNDFYCFEGCIL